MASRRRTREVAARIAGRTGRGIRRRIQRAARRRGLSILNWYLGKRRDQCPFPLTPALSLREREFCGSAVRLVPKPWTVRPSSVPPEAAPSFSLSPRERAGVRGKVSFLPATCPNLIRNRRRIRVHSWFSNRNLLVKLLAR